MNEKIETAVAEFRVFLEGEAGKPRNGNTCLAIAGGKLIPIIGKAVDADDVLIIDDHGKTLRIKTNPEPRTGWYSGVDSLEAIATAQYGASAEKIAKAQVGVWYSGAERLEESPRSA